MTPTSSEPPTAPTTVAGADPQGRTDASPAPVGGSHASPAPWREAAAGRVARAYEAAHGREIEDTARGFRIGVEPRVAIALVVTLAVGAVVAWALLRASAPATPAPWGEEAAATASATPVPTAAASVTAGTVWVHVSGAVEQPGLVEVPAGSRVADAIDMAGGATAQADLGSVNLARIVADAEQVHVAEPGATSAAEGPISVNRASADQLEELPGIGPVIAARIVADREANGPFASLADLTRVSGVGDAMVAGLEQVATV
ncbi:ComEA family DNA-binding protein [Demequina globuliformis]|uniref:ComEA family DNA-binding protein n=1 Tax=Demequina globuliformis TaxID=676202 RepID=UPI000782AC65|nr:ComEA family DNA-binding protein [Demequina globuliformis]